jgi:hypothetical protein
VNGAAPRLFYLPPAGRIVPGALFLHVPVAYSPDQPVAASAVAGALLQVQPDFERVWQVASPRLREVGVFTVLPTKPRPVVVLAVGAAEEDAWHRDKAWVAPRYSRKEHGVPRRGRNIVDLPAAPHFGLDEDGFLDLFQVTSLPVSYLAPRRHACNLTPDAFNGVLAALRACAGP